MGEKEKTKVDASIPSVDDIFNEDDYMLEDDYLEAAPLHIPAAEVKEAAPAGVQIAEAAPVAPAHAPAAKETAVVPKQQESVQISRRRSRRRNDRYVQNEPEDVVIVEVPQKDKKLVNISEHFSSEKISPIENAFYTISLIKPTAIFAEAAINGVAGIFDKMIDSRYQVNVKFKKIEANVKPTDTQPGVEPHTVTIAPPEPAGEVPFIEGPKDIIPQ